MTSEAEFLYDDLVASLVAAGFGTEEVEQWDGGSVIYLWRGNKYRLPDWLFGGSRTPEERERHERERLAEYGTSLRGSLWVSGKDCMEWELCLDNSAAFDKQSTCPVRLRSQDLLGWPLDAFVAWLLARCEEMATEGGYRRSNHYEQIPLPPPPPKG